MKHSELYNPRVHHTESIVTFPTGNVKDKCVFDLDFSGEVPARRKNSLPLGEGGCPSGQTDEGRQGLTVCTVQRLPLHAGRQTPRRFLRMEFQRIGACRRPYKAPPGVRQYISASPGEGSPQKVGRFCVALTLPGAYDRPRHPSPAGAGSSISRSAAYRAPNLPHCAVPDLCSPARCPPPAPGPPRR